MRRGLLVQGQAEQPGRRNPLPVPIVGICVMTRYADFSDVGDVKMSMEPALSADMRGRLGLRKYPSVDSPWWVDVVRIDDYRKGKDTWWEVRLFPVNTTANKMAAKPLKTWRCDSVDSLRNGAMMAELMMVVK